MNYNKNISILNIISIKIFYFNSLKIYLYLFSYDNLKIKNKIIFFL
jgi:hypothetical protein